MAEKRYLDLGRVRVSYSRVSPRALATEQRYALANECGDVVQAVVNLSYACGIDLRAALDRCEERNRERGCVS